MNVILLQGMYFIHNRKLQEHFKTDSCSKPMGIHIQGRVCSSTNAMYKGVGLVPQRYCLRNGLIPQRSCSRDGSWFHKCQVQESVVGSTKPMFKGWELVPKRLCSREGDISTTVLFKGRGLVPQSLCSRDGCWFHKCQV